MSHRVMRAFAALLFAISCSAEPPPHVIQILLDDWGWGDIGAQSPLSRPQTPNIGRLVSSGSLATSWHGGSPVCSPSRVALLTSRFPAELRVHTALAASHAENAAIGCTDFVPVDTPLIPSLLKEYGGYATAHYGKWHLGSTTGAYEAPCPSAYGGASGFNDTLTYCSASDACPQLANFSDPWFPSNSSRLIVDAGIAFAERALARGEPFYVNLHFHISHAPLLPTPAQLANYPPTGCAYSGNPPEPSFYPHCPEQVFRASQHEADAQIGRLLDWLISLNIEGDTIIFCTADNGPEAPEVYFNSVGLTGPFRGRKRSLYEGGTRVPAVWRWPQHIRGGAVVDDVMAHVDFAPTLLALTGLAARVPKPTTALWSGVDVSSVLLTGARAPLRTTPLMWEWRYAVLGPCWHSAPRLAIRDPVDTALVALWEPASANASARLELYNTTADPGQLHDLALVAPDDAERLRARLAQWLAALPDGPGIVPHPVCAEYVIPQPNGPRTAATEGEASRGFAAARAALPTDAAALYHTA